MPIYADPEHRNDRPPPVLRDPPANHELEHRLSEESLRTEFCEGPIPDNESTQMAHDYQESGRHNPNDSSMTGASNYDRAELIQRIKHGESLRWIPQQLETASTPLIDHESQVDEDLSPRSRPSASLLPAIELKGPIPSGQDPTTYNEAQAPRAEHGLTIPRSRPVLHSGNYINFDHGIVPDLPISTTSPHIGEAALPSAGKESRAISLNHDAPRSIPTQSQARSVSNFSRPILQPSNTAALQRTQPGNLTRPQRPRAPSLQTYSTSFKFPTSPLARQSSYDDDDGETLLRPQRHQENRRKTLPTEFYQNLRSLPSTLAQAARQPSSFQPDLSFSYQSRDVQRSATFSSPFLASASPPTPNFLRSRRSSFSTDASPLQPSSMVGSYEESILRGRMSSMPSKPVDFTAQIGAFGKGDCKPKHPAHVSLTFPAVFYNWSPVDMPTTTEPSPYVGQIDIEHGLPPPQKKQRKSKEPDANDLSGSEPRKMMAGPAPEHARQRWRRSPSPSTILIGGCYRLPQCGQLQILIKNPNNTPVKLFLVPYDLQDMEAGMKTFIRQNHYTTGPIIENALTSKSSAETAIDNKKSSGNTQEKPKLRYSVHLHICCPAKGKFYLYKGIKVVFTHRVPDNKEQLRSEIRLPEPRYTPYKLLNEVSSSPSMAEARASLDNQRRRRSYQSISSAEDNRILETRYGTSLGNNTDALVPPVPEIPPLDSLAVRSKSVLAVEDTGSLADQTTNTEQSPQTTGPQLSLSDKLSKINSNFTGSVRSSSSNGSSSSGYNKLTRGDVGYGGLFARPGTPEAGEGLLTRKLRKLEKDRAKQT